MAELKTKSIEKDVVEFINQIEDETKRKDALALLKIFRAVTRKKPKILARRGQHVNQGDIIGKVGSTGLATGPHVCYRFWKNGQQVDALKLKLPNSEPMDKRNLPRFLTVMKPLKRELDSVSNLKFKKQNN